MQKKKIVYIAHPIGGDVEGNLKKLRNIVRQLNMTYRDIVPFVPYYADVVSMDDSDPHQRERGIENDVALFLSGVIDEVWLYGDRISDGMREEIDLARQLAIPVIAVSDHLYAELQEHYRCRVVSAP